MVDYLCRADISTNNLCSLYLYCLVFFRNLPLDYVGPLFGLFHWYGHNINRREDKRRGLVILKEPKYSFWGNILRLYGLNWRGLKPIDWSKLEPKKRQKKERIPSKR